MIMKDFMGMVTRDKRKKVRADAAKQIAVSVGVAVIAAAAGVATGILLAPKSGRETREELMGSCKHCVTQQDCCQATKEVNDPAENALDTENV
jgi:gas vesicle protein